MGTRDRSGRRPGPELHFGYNYSRGRIPNAGAAAPHSRPFKAIFALSLALVVLVGTVATWGSDVGIVDVLFASAALGRGIALLIGFVGLPMVLVYYYSAGIDWPFDEASRIVMIGALLLLVLCALVMLVGRYEGWLDARSLRAWVAPSLLTLAAGAGYLGQRSGS